MRPCTLSLILYVGILHMYLIVICFGTIFQSQEILNLGHTPQQQHLTEAKSNILSLYAPSTKIIHEQFLYVHLKKSSFL